jgi:RNA polymerase sigma-70 factor (ECF subfamily)
VEVSDGDLVRLARAGDAVAFRLLVERHRPMARARAARLCSRPDDVDDVVQESFLRAFVALERLRDPDRFAGWLGGIVVNVHRAMARRAPVMLLADWPERLHPRSADGLPSADDLDRADAVGAAVAELPAGQRQAVTLFYYADLPAGRIADSPGAVKASLHKARRRLREHIIAHRPDLIPVASRRTLMTTVRIAHAEPQPGRLADGTFVVERVLVVLADDPGGRAVPIWLNAFDGESVRVLFEPPIGQAVPAPVQEELTDRLLRAAGASVTAVEIDELGPEVAAARIELATAAGTRHVTGRLGDGLALAAGAGAPVRVAGPLMDRLAVPVQGGDLLGPFRRREPTAARPVMPHPQARNLAFTDGLDAWQLHGGFLRDVSGSHWQDYSCTTEGRSAILTSVVPQPYGSAHLGQEILADACHGQNMVFRGELRTENVAGQARLYLRVITELPGRACHDHYSATVTGSHDWARHQAAAQIPGNAVLVQFGVSLTGRGRVELRNAKLTRAS